jgi:hypothetical protein
LSCPIVKHGGAASPLTLFIFGLVEQSMPHRNLGDGLFHGEIHRAKRP